MSPTAATRLALTVLAAVHLIVTIWHGELRRELAVALSPWQSLVIYLFFIVAPLLAVGLLWTRHVRPALWVFLAALGASLVFGIYYRYILISPENIHRLPPGVAAAHARFAVSAAIRALIDLACALGTAFVLGWYRARESASCDKVQLTHVMSGFAVLITCCLIFTAGAANACDGPREVREATRAELKAFIRSKQMKVLTFTGYSGAQYEDPEALMQHASRVLDGQASAKTLINIGATAEGIGAVYEIAKQKGFTTMGIVSTLARDEHVALSKCVDYVFFVKDSTWGGQVPGTKQLSPTSAAIVASGTAFVAIGGGDVTRDEMLAARGAGKPVTFIPADMNHKIAREKAQKRGEAEPTDFRGSAHRALAR